MLLGIGLFAVVAIGFWLWLEPRDHAMEVAPESDNEAIQEMATYQSEEYGFSFTAPAMQDIHEYVPEVVAIGNATANGFETEAEFNVVLSEAEGGYASFEAFLFESTKNMCAADGPNETIYCTDIMNVEEFTTDSGLSGLKFYQHRVYENFTTGTKIEDRMGPIYAFDIKANVPDSDFATLIVRPSATLKESEVNNGLIDDLAHNLRIDRVESR